MVKFRICRLIGAGVALLLLSTPFLHAGEMPKAPRDQQGESRLLAQAEPSRASGTSAQPTAPPAGAAQDTPQGQAPACTPTKVGELIERFKLAEASVRRAPSAALDAVKQAEGLLPCLVEVPTQAQLQNLFRLKGLAQHLARAKGSAQDSFYQAAAIDSTLQCGNALGGYSSPALTRELVELCEKATLEAADTEIRVRLVSLKGAQAVYVDGVEQTLGDDFISIRLIAGGHLVQAKSQDQIRSAWVSIAIPDADDGRFQEVDFRKFKLIVVAEQKVAVGTLRLEGLEPGTEVMVDGRTRRDLPLLRNLEVGERHLMIRSPDGSVMGVTVSISADQETVYTLAGSDAGGGSGLALRPILAWGTLGLSALLTAGSGVTLSLAQGQFSEASTAYSAYAESRAGTPAEFDALWAAVQTHLDSGRSLRTTGLVLGGAALVSAGGGAFLLLTGDADQTSARQLRPYVLPWTVTDDEIMSTGIQLGLKGQF